MKTYESIRKFGYDLFVQCMQEKNPVLSPVSAYLTLVMAGCGAGGTTRTEFNNVLGEDMAERASDLMHTLTAKGEFLNLSIANSVWIDQRFLLNLAWEETIKSLLGADVFSRDLPSCQTMKEINQWIAEQTNGLIDQLLTEPLGPKELIRLVLLNTIYFKGKWESPFAPFHTHKEAFYLCDEQNNNWKEQLSHKTVQAHLMRNDTADVRYITNDIAEGVLLPYQTNQERLSGFHVIDCLNTDRKHLGKGLGLIALKPRKNRLIRDVCRALSECAVHELLSNSQPDLVDLKLPKFKSSFDINLIEPLTRIGLSECFDQNRSNLSQIGKDAKTGDTLYVSLVRQKAVLTVDEEGTEAAAATELVGCLRAMSRPQKKLYFNEPFLYMIMDMERELPLFIGILDNPDLLGEN